MNLLAFLDEFPPVAVRLAARDRTRPLTNADIAERCGLSRNTVNSVSRKRTWAGVSVGVASLFCAGCMVDIVRRRRLREFLKRRKLHHLSKGNRRYFVSLVNENTKD